MFPIVRISSSADLSCSHFSALEEDLLYYTGWTKEKYMYEYVMNIHEFGHATYDKNSENNLNEFVCCICLSSVFMTSWQSDDQKIFQSNTFVFLNRLIHHIKYSGRFLDYTEESEKMPTRISSQNVRKMDKKCSKKIITSTQKCKLRDYALFASKRSKLIKNFSSKMLILAFEVIMHQPQNTHFP